MRRLPPAELIYRIEAVLAFDWSGNDPDAYATICRLREAVETVNWRTGVQPSEVSLTLTRHYVDLQEAALSVYRAKRGGRDFELLQAVNHLCHLVEEEYEPLPEVPAADGADGSSTVRRVHDSNASPLHDSEVLQLRNDKRVLQALVEDFQKAVDSSGRHHLISPENVNHRMENLCAILAEAWETLSDVCEFHADPAYQLDVPEIRELLQRIEAAKRATAAPTARPVQPPRVPLGTCVRCHKYPCECIGKVITPLPTPRGCPNCGCVDQLNVNCSNHIIR
jgi:hypothetical protein